MKIGSKGFRSADSAVPDCPTGSKIQNHDANCCFHNPRTTQRTVGASREGSRLILLIRLAVAE